jgi:hypothetical protein
MPSPSKYTVKNVNLVLDLIDDLTISDKDLRIKISEITGLIHPLALKQFIKSMEELDYIVFDEDPEEWMIRDRRDGTNGKEHGVY